MEPAVLYPLPENEARILSCQDCQSKNRVLLSRAFEQPEKLRCGNCQAPLLCTRDAELLGLQASLYQHPLDQKSLRALEAVPGVSTLLRKLVEFTIGRYDRLFNESCFVRVGGSQLPSLERLFERAALALGMGSANLPTLYLYQNGELNAYTGGVDQPYVALSSALCDLLTEEEIMAVMAHELSHCQSQHVLYKTAARIFTYAATSLATATLGIGNLLLAPLQFALLEWDRCSELTADRGMLLGVRDPVLALRVLSKLAAGSIRFAGELSLDRFMEQALRARQAGETDVLDRIFSVLQTASRTHPFPLWRAAELWRWACNGEYLSLLRLARPPLAR
jgi:Zn-dependent protease with chaperone function